LLLFLEVISVFLYIALPPLRYACFGVNRANRADRLARAAINTLIGANKVLIGFIVRIDTIHRTHLDASTGLYANTRLTDYIGHWAQVLRFSSWLGFSPLYPMARFSRLKFALGRAPSEPLDETDKSRNRARSHRYPEHHPDIEILEDVININAVLPEQAIRSQLLQHRDAAA